MKRRAFIAKAATGVAAGIASAPAIAGGTPAIQWRLASSFPKSLETIFGAGEVMARRVAQLTDGKFTIRVFPGGELVPALQVLDAVQAGTVEMGHTASYYYFGKDATFAFDTSFPFGLTSRQQTAWMHQGGGRGLMREFFAGYGILNFMGGNTGCQMGGWFRREVKTTEDLNGLKMRVGGFAGRVLQRLGVVPQTIPGGDIYPSLEKGTIDAAEWVGPHDDEKLGFYKVAPYYYTPGWWETGTQLSFYVARKEWEKLPALYQSALEVATYEAHMNMQAMYDALNPVALARLVKNGAKLRAFPRPVLDACYAAAQDVIAEEAAKNPAFRKVLEPWRRFQRFQNNWFGVAEGPMLNYLISKKSV